MEKSKKEFVLIENFRVNYVVAEEIPAGSSVYLNAEGGAVPPKSSNAKNYIGWVGRVKTDNSYKEGDHIAVNTLGNIEIKIKDDLEVGSFFKNDKSTGYAIASSKTEAQGKILKKRDGKDFALSLIFG